MEMLTKLQVPVVWIYRKSALATKSKLFPFQNSTWNLSDSCLSTVGVFFRPLVNCFWTLWNPVTTWRDASLTFQGGVIFAKPCAWQPRLRPSSQLLFLSPQEPRQPKKESDLRMHYFLKKSFIWQHRYAHGFLCFGAFYTSNFDDLRNVYFDAPIGKNDKPNLVEWNTRSFVLELLFMNKKGIQIPIITKPSILPWKWHFWTLRFSAPKFTKRLVSL